MEIIVFVSCSPMGSGFKGTGKISDVQRFLNEQTGGKVTDVELIYTVHVDEWVWNIDISFDGAEFWKGNDKAIPAHDILFFSGYSPELESYIFVQFNDKEDTKSYYTLSNYNLKKIEKEKEDIKNLVTNVTDILSNKGIEVLNIYYQKFIEEDDLNNIYIQPKDFFDEFFLANDFYAKNERNINFKESYQLWIIIESTNIEIETYKDRIEFQKSIISVFDDIENYGISISIYPENGKEIVLYKGMIIYD